MSYRTKLLASAIAPAPLGGLSEPLIPKNNTNDADADADREEEQNDPWSSLGVIVGAIVLGAAG
jgi:hypothetical protein